jgi:thymidylate kinase
VLLVLRGNSGAGKSTVAKAVRGAYGRRDLALVSQDIVRRQILRERDVAGGANIDLLDSIVRWSLGRGYHVLLEGILASARYGDMLKALRHDHLASSFWFYLDVPFEETVRRHHTRPQRDEFTAEQMAEWYQERDLLDGGDETVIDSDSSLMTTTSTIMARSGLARVAMHP